MWYLERRTDCQWSISNCQSYLSGRCFQNSIALCGEDQDVIYDRIYIGYKYTFVEPGQVGCALSCTPAVYMAQNAIPADMKPADLCQMTISDWEEKLGLEELTIFE